MQDRLNQFPHGSTGWKKLWILIEDSPKNKESKKGNGAQFRARMRENRLKQCNVFIKRGWSCRTGWTGSQLVQPIEENSEILTENSPKNKESNKRNNAQFWARMRNNRLKQCKVFIKRENDSKQIFNMNKIKWDQWHQLNEDHSKHTKKQFQHNNLWPFSSTPINKASSILKQPERGTECKQEFCE